MQKFLLVDDRYNMIDNSKCKSNYHKNDKLTSKKKGYYEANKEKIKKYNEEYRKANKEKIKLLKQNRPKDDTIIEYIREKKKTYIANKRSTDPIFYAKQKISNLIHSSFKKFLKKSINNTEAESILGCTFAEFEKHISSQFDENMSWENHGKYWEYDHILPVSLGKDIKRLKELNHYSNFRPLNVTLNRRKSNKLDGAI